MRRSAAVSSNEINPHNITRFQLIFKPESFFFIKFLEDFRPVDFSAIKSSIKLEKKEKCSIIL
jgi:hypothetical protein